MCGIVGYLGKKEAEPVLMAGLKRLEYRGYDSAGLVVLDKNQKANLEKTIGRVSNLEERIAGSARAFTGKIGIAHTRWATHGKVSEKNAHPHADCSKTIFVVHNGIIENFKELKAKLTRAGHKFRSETDTEVIPHLIEEFGKDGSLPLEEAARQALMRIKGTYGLAILSSKEPEKIVLARNFSPLIFGVGEDEFIAASDPSAILSFTKNVVYLGDGEIAVLTPFAYKILTVGNQPIDRQSEKINWDIETAQKNGYPHFMLKEIFEEPEAVRNSIRGRLDEKNGTAVFGGLKSVEEKLENAKKIFISACGSAYLAGKIGEYLLEEIAGLSTEVDYASEFRYRQPVLGKDDVFLAISQSGETADTLASLYEVKERNLLSLGLVNVVGSTISRETDAGIYQHIGPEIGVASTKSFVSQAAILTLFSLFLGRKRGLSLVSGREIIREIKRIPELMEIILGKKTTIKKLAAKYKNCRNFFYLGRKYNFPVALEGALKIKEIAYVHAEGYASGEMKHGPIAMIDKNLVSVVVAPADSLHQKVVSNIEEIKARGGPVLALATEGDKQIKKIADDVIYIPKTLETLNPLLAVLALHLFAYYAGVAKGYDVDRPRNLAKSVTVE